MVTSTRRRTVTIAVGDGAPVAPTAPAAPTPSSPGISAEGRTATAAASMSSSKKRKRRGSAPQPSNAAAAPTEETTAADAEWDFNDAIEGEQKDEAQRSDEADSKLPPSSPAPPSSPFTASALPLRVFVGTYSGVLYCLDSLQSVAQLLASPPIPPSSSPSESSFFTLFSHEAHRQSVHALAASPSGSHLLSGGVDETIQVFSLAPRPSHLGSLHRHYSSITALAFPTSSHFLSASEEGSIAVFALPSFEAVTRLRGHRGAAQAMAVHESGKAAMTAGRDGVVRVWDLVKGVERTRRWMGEEKRGIAEGGSGQAYEPLLVRWRGSGAAYVLARGRTLVFYGDEGEEQRRLDVGSRVLAVAAVLAFVLVGCDDGRLLCFHADTGRRTAEVRHEARVRAVEAVKVTGGGVLVVSASTDGQLVVWRLNQGEEGEGEEGTLDRVGQVKGQMRVTAMCAGVAWDESREAEAVDGQEGEGLEEVGEGVGAAEESKAAREPTEAQLRRKEKKKRRLMEKIRGSEQEKGAHNPSGPVEGREGATAAAYAPRSQAKRRHKRMRTAEGGGQAAASVPSVKPPSTAAKVGGAVKLVNRKARAH